MFLPAVFVQGMDRGYRRITRKKYGSVTSSIARKGSRGKFPLAESRGSASGGVWGNAPTVPQETCMPKRSQQRRRQRSVPASNFARPQTRPPAAHSATHILSRQMGATDQHETRFVFHCWSFFVAEDFASAETTRGLCGCALWPASHCTSMFLDFYRCKGNRTRKHRNFGTQNRRWKDIPILPAATILAYFFSDPIAPVIRTAPEITASSIRMKERMNGTPSAPMVDVPPKISTRSSMRKLISVTR